MASVSVYTIGIRRETSAIIYLNSDWNLNEQLHIRNDGNLRALTLVVNVSYRNDSLIFDLYFEIYRLLSIVCIVHEFDV